ncbi:unnamed protein product [Moneuplotes crassus]|uniref:Uncharacterized protein n=1 Tax=Euplotes crassus TaxID=5936 RepID=A0AAD1YBZ3_EUPCR|nr:unnamed protein product [Moneuplotes crassus]
MRLFSEPHLSDCYSLCSYPLKVAYCFLEIFLINLLYLLTVYLLRCSVPCKVCGNPFLGF